MSWSWLHKRWEVSESATETRSDWGSKYKTKQNKHYLCTSIRLTPSDLVNSQADLNKINKEPCKVWSKDFHFCPLKWTVIVFSLWMFFNELCLSQFTLDLKPHYNSEQRFAIVVSEISTEHVFGQWSLASMPLWEVDWGSKLKILLL